MSGDPADKLPADRHHYQYVVINADGTWGRGNTVADAQKNARDAGSKKRTPDVVYSCPDNARDAQVDSSGCLVYWLIDESGPVPVKQKKTLRDALKSLNESGSTVIPDIE